jgi:CDP-glucose 4,6-dehydratase
MAFQNPDTDFWHGRRVLVTGQTGFKGAWLAFWLNRLGARVFGIGLAPVTTPNLFELADIAGIAESHYCDIRDYPVTARTVSDARPDVVFHLAAQALVRHGYSDPLGTFGTNVQGTANLLEALRSIDSVRVVVVVTTDKVYRNLEHPYPYREADALGGHDPYSASKAAAEMIVASYRDSYLESRGVAVASARAGNVIGGGDWAEDRLIPDAIRAWSRQEPLVIRRPAAIRPWQHVLESLGGYLALAERLWSDGALAGAYNFGPETHEAASVRDVVRLARTVFGTGDISWGDGDDGPHEAGWLALEVAKARFALDVQPRWPLEEAVRRTMGWYRAHAELRDPRQLCSDDIDAYEATSHAPATL